LRLPSAAHGEFLAPLLPNSLDGEEVRMNYDTFRYILDNELWNQSGQLAFLKSGQAFAFPKSSIEIKARWKKIQDADRARYHWNQDAGGNTYGLVGLHIETKEIPNWFWATFEHKDNPGRCLVNGCSQYGLDGGNLGTEIREILIHAGLPQYWENYRLTGSQTDFVDSTGRRIRLGNSSIEGSDPVPMEKSSCITCHAEARLLAGGGFPKFTADTGAPSPCWFYGPPTPSDPPVCEDPKAPILARQTDFVWSLRSVWQ
jgi:hypothetical protein